MQYRTLDTIRSTLRAAMNPECMICQYNTVANAAASCSLNASPFAPRDRRSLGSLYFTLMISTTTLIEYSQTRHMRDILYELFLVFTRGVDGRSRV